MCLAIGVVQREVRRGLAERSHALFCVHVLLQPIHPFTPSASTPTTSTSDNLEMRVSTDQPGPSIDVETWERGRVAAGGLRFRSRAPRCLSVASPAWPTLRSARSAKSKAVEPQRVRAVRNRSQKPEVARVDNHRLRQRHTLQTYRSAGRQTFAPPYSEPHTISSSEPSFAATSSAMSRGSSHTLNDTAGPQPGSKQPGPPHTVES